MGPDWKMDCTFRERGVTGVCGAYGWRSLEGGYTDFGLYWLGMCRECSYTKDVTDIDWKSKISSKILLTSKIPNP